MIRQRIYLKHYKWEAWIYYAVDDYYTDEIMLRLNDIGCSRHDLRSAYDNLSSGEMNSGLTYSNFYGRKSVIVIAITSTAKEFAKSWRHEMGHLATHIAIAYKIDLTGEEVQYIGDDIVGETWEVAQLFLCDCKCCKNKKIERIG